MSPFEGRLYRKETTPSSVAAAPQVVDLGVEVVSKKAADIVDHGLYFDKK